MKAMIESPLIQEIVEESEQRATALAIGKVLKARFGATPDTIQPRLTQIKDAKRLERLIHRAALCMNLQEFEERLREELSAPAPTSTRGKRRTQKPAS
jgi:hypothetical protein